MCGRSNIPPAVGKKVSVWWERRAPISLLRHDSAVDGEDRSRRPRSLIRGEVKGGTSDVLRSSQPTERILRFHCLPYGSVFQPWLCQRRLCQRGRDTVAADAVLRVVHGN